MLIPEVRTNSLLRRRGRRPWCRQQWRDLALYAVLLAAPWWGGACTVESGTMFELVAMSRPAVATCIFNPDSPLIESSGFYDPAGQDGYVLAPMFVNHMVDETYDDVQNASGDNIRPSANSITITGFETCFYRENDPNLDVNQLTPKGQTLVDCTSLPQAQQRFIVSSGTAPPDGGRNLAIIEVLTHQDLRALYGDDFNPMAIPNIGPYGEDGDGDGFTDGPSDFIRFSQLSEDPSSPTRSVAWGNFPEAREDRVVIQLRAVGKLQTGQAITSNWRHFPINVAVGVVDGACGDMFLQQCITTCGSDLCQGAFADVHEQRRCVLDNPGQCGGTCPANGQACLPFAFAGPYTQTAGSCLAYQGITAPVCANFNGCDPAGPNP